MRHLTQVVINNLRALFTVRVRSCTAAALGLLLTGIAAAPTSYAVTSGIFGGGPFYKDRTVSIPEIKSSGFTEAVVWNIEVKSNGDLNFNGEFPLVSGGVYIGGETYPNFASDMAELKTGTITRVTFSVGSSNVGDWQDVEALVDAQGTGSSSILYQNFQALKAAIPALDAIDFDDENNYDESSTVQFAVMLGNLRYHVTLDAYTNTSYWTSVASEVNAQLPGTVDSVHLQAYAGGAGNNPCSGWDFGSVPVFPGLWDQDDTLAEVQSIMTGWHDECGITGGFIWLYDDFVGTGLAAQYAAAINDALGVSTGTTYNQSNGIVTDGTSFSGGLDGDGNAYSANLLGSTLAWNGVTFTFGPANGVDAISGAGQTITLTQTQASSLSVLATAVNGAQTSQTFLVNYTDGSSDAFTRSLSDWYVFADYSGESIALSMVYRDTSSGGEDNRTFNLYGYTLATNDSKAIESITLPDDPDVKVLAIQFLP
jgi:hypothetical protein